MSDSKDQSFDGRSDKFKKNIYGTTKGKLRLDLLKLSLSQQLDLNASLKVLDIGGGQGQIAIWLAAMGHQVTLVEPSEEMLEQARQNAESANVSLNCIQSSCQSFQCSERFDLVLCHAVFEWLEEPRAALQKLTGFVQPRGHLSLMFFGSEGRLFTNLVYGNFDYIEQDFNASGTVQLNPQNPSNISDVEHWCQEAGLRCQFSHGVRSFYDLMKPQDQNRVAYSELLEMEWKYGQHPDYKRLSRYYHMILTPSH